LLREFDIHLEQVRNSVEVINLMIQVEENWNKVLYHHVNWKQFEIHQIEDEKHVLYVQLMFLYKVKRFENVDRVLLEDPKFWSYLRNENVCFIKNKIIFTIISTRNNSFRIETNASNKFIMTFKNTKASTTFNIPNLNE
jgi:hypothetical protein